MMLKNNTKALLRQGKTVIGTWLEEVRNSAVAQLFAAAGLHFLIVDMEHGAYNFETMADIVRTARLVGITPLVRIPDLSWERVGRVLDAGAQGLMLPRVKEPQEVEQFLTFLKYPPAGQRGMMTGLGNTDFKWVTTKEYIDFITDEILVLVQIETKEAAENLEALAKVPDVDVLFIGPEDLSIALGFPGQQSHPQVIETIDHIIATTLAHDIVAGIHTSDLSALPTLTAKGVRWINYASDIEFLYNGANEAVQALKEAT